MDKQAILRNFSRASSSYNTYADVQRKCAIELSSMLVCLPEPDAILDLGAGTGFMSEILADAFPRSALAMNDLSVEMLEMVPETLRTRANLYVGDMETLDFGHYDIVVSNMAIQWIADISCAINKFCRLSTGVFAFSTIISGTFAEWLHIIHGRDAMCPFPSEAKLRSWLNNALVFRVANFHHECANAREAALYLRKLGVNYTQHTSDIGSVYKAIRAHKGGVTLSYRVALVIMAGMAD